MTVRKFTQGDTARLEKLFCEYFAELDCDDEPLALFKDCLLPDLNANLLSVGVAEEDGNLSGFIIFQIDDVINDWCFLEGKGDIREIYVAPASRRKKTGAQLLAFAESALKGEGAKEVYLLPTDESEPFFIRCGYSDFGDYCAELDCKVFGKIL